MYEYNIGKMHYEIMRQCYNENCKTYKSYGAVGIKVCDAWHDREVFKEWCRENGWENHKNLRVLRYDSSKDYCPENCYIGESKFRAGYGRAQMMRDRIAANKKKKAEIGVKRVSDSPIHGTYGGMKDRCRNPNNINYKNYGGRGIKVCDEWKGKDGFYNFARWALANGWHEGLTLDRIDINGNYEPDNCRWVDWETQANNKRCVVKYEYDGEMLSIAQIARRANVSEGMLRRQVNELKKTIPEAIAYCKEKQGKK